MLTPFCRYLWIRLALYDKKLSRIIEHLVTNATRYYERDSLVADSDYGSILGSLLVGPCALDYTRAKTPDHFWTDPPADELIQRQRISSGHPTPPTYRRPILNFKRSLHSSEDGSTGSFKSSSSASVAKDYVESLHQNSRATLLYGKNNVSVLPVSGGGPVIDESFDGLGNFCVFAERCKSTDAGLFKLTSNGKLVDHQMDAESIDEWL